MPEIKDVSTDISASPQSARTFLEFAKAFQRYLEGIQGANKINDSLRALGFKPVEHNPAVIENNKKVAQKAVDTCIDALRNHRVHPGFITPIAGLPDYMGMSDLEVNLFNQRYIPLTISHVYEAIGIDMSGRSIPPEINYVEELEREKKQGTARRQAIYSISKALDEIYNGTYPNIEEALKYINKNIERMETSKIGNVRISPSANGCSK